MKFCCFVFQRKKSAVFLVQVHVGKMERLLMLLNWMRTLNYVWCVKML